MRKRTLAGAAVALLALGGCSTPDYSVVPGPEPGTQPAPPPADASALPEGSHLAVELEQTIDAGESRVGDRFVATVREALVARDGAVVIPAGARVHGVVTGLRGSEHPGDSALVRLSFERIAFGGRSYPFSADVLETDVAAGGQAAGRARETAAPGTVLTGAELSVAREGALLGAGAGTVVYLGAGEVEPRLPAGTRMTLRATRTVSLR